MKTRFFAAWVAFVLCGTGFAAGSTDELESVSTDVFPSYCRFGESVPAALSYDPIKGRFEFGGEGSLVIQAQGMKKISYSTNAVIYRPNGQDIGQGREWDFSQVTLAGSNGNLDTIPNCITSDCFGVAYALPSLVKETYTLTASGSFSPPKSYTPILGDEFYVIFKVDCIK